ncbi:MAG: ATP-binding protein [Microbacterium sp.]|jgi:signal transduction histidine kinase|uniref:sensor histidine kinase n=1 Tax=unclassified Microbacterium TaxID=2609290 RepID=UPI000DB154CF|nr:histidine kinase [Microbacterium sp.]PZU40423.1 MAG: ATP-binding protein [Microbacterium sp.]
MPAARDLVLGQGVHPAEDELRLPRPPGLIRRFWSRHPLAADILLAVLAFVLTTPALVMRSPVAAPAGGWSLGAAFALLIVGCIALVWRRRWPVSVFSLSLVPTLLFDPSLSTTLSGPVSVIAMYTIAVYRGARVCWIAFAVAGGLIATQTLVGVSAEPSSAGTYLNVDISTVVFLLLGALIGVNVGNRKRYLEALIARSRQLLVERDQQARLAAAAERTRIAREMHDVVSHSLTVIVALSEGASVTADPERSREASRAVATTARDALTEMREMLGVLRDDRPEDAPLAPAQDGSLDDIVDAARRAGFPVQLALTGSPTSPPAIMQAIRRVVQEGLTNAMRYAHDPRFIRVHVTHAPAEITVDVRNDGSRPHEPSRGTGLGLMGLRERLEHLGGTLEAGMISPDQWRLRARIPLEGANE